MNRWHDPGDEGSLDDDEEQWREEVVNEAVAGDPLLIGDEWDATDFSDQDLELDEDDPDADADPDADPDADLDADDGRGFADEP